MALYEITYAIIPAGVGPDDYEPGDLERRTESVELPDPVAGGILPNGLLITYGSPSPQVHEALTPRIPAGARPVVLRMELMSG
ncbi:hypothetical protein [Streptomyces sp. NPDC047718]|uniref:hypothetical protein n=1 Tax=Streptomyces sp. NPDC047718 TaxID=3155479 RepID=UPI0033CF338E